MFPYLKVQIYREPGIMTWHFRSAMCRNQNLDEKGISDLHLYFSYFLHLSFFSFSYLFAAVINLLLSLLPVQKFPRKHNQDRRARSAVKGNFTLRYSLKFLSIFVHNYFRLHWPNHSDWNITEKIFSSIRT